MGCFLNLNFFTQTLIQYHNLVLVTYQSDNEVSLEFLLFLVIMVSIKNH
jgi:hypothetical protein